MIQLRAAPRCAGCPGCDYNPNVRNFTPLHCPRCGHITCQGSPVERVEIAAGAEEAQDAGEWF
jgi:uncharacterized paraquat-inducible protein A